VREPRVSVVIRTKDEARDLGAVLDVLARQSVGRDGVEVVVVDSGSADATVSIAAAAGARVIEIASDSFNFGGALNTGCAATSAPVIVSLSGHAYPPDGGWLERMLGHFEDERVACATGAGAGPTGEPLAGPLLQDDVLAERHPFWGYSNAAGAFRADLWRERPFRDDMPGVEDKEWALHWLRRGRLAVLDPELNTAHDHSRDPALARYRRARREWRGFGMFLDVPPASARELVARGLTDPDRRLRVRPGTWAGLLGEYLERRSGRP
jgi:rhamnosyltransferase